MWISGILVVLLVWIKVDYVAAANESSGNASSPSPKAGTSDHVTQNGTEAEVKLLDPSEMDNDPFKVTPATRKDPVGSLDERGSSNKTDRERTPFATKIKDPPTTVVKYFIVPSPKNEKDLKAAVLNATEAVEDLIGGSVSGLIGGGTQVYIIAIIGVLPAAGAAIWCLKWALRKRQKAKQKASSGDPDESDPSSASQPGAGLVKSYVKTVEPNVNYQKGNVNQPKDTFQYTEDKYLKPVWPQYQHQHLRSTPSTGSQNHGFAKWEFPKSQLNLQEILGEGNFGQVWRAEAKKLNGMPGVAIVAVKTVKANASYKEKQDILKEIEIMQGLGRHPNVVTLLGCCSKQEPFYVIMEYVVRGKLLSYLRSHRSSRNYYNCHPTSHSLTSRDLTHFAFQVVQGMEFIASRGVIHRDLAARNVLVDHNQVCKIADFGLAKYVRDQHGEVYEQKSRGALPIRWMAPESLYMNVFTTKTDVWAFGILLWEIVTLGSTPYPGMGPREVIHYVCEGNVMERPHHCRWELYRVMRNSWSADPKDRPSFSSLKKDLGRLLELQAGYIDLEHFPENCYYNLYQSPGERV